MISMKIQHYWQSYQTGPHCQLLKITRVVKYVTQLYFGCLVTFYRFGVKQQQFERNANIKIMNLLIKIPHG